MYCKPFKAALISASVPEKVIVVLYPPSPLRNISPSVCDSVRVPAPESNGESHLDERLGFGDRHLVDEDDLVGTWSHG